MSQTFRLTLAQLNPTVGAIEANIALALEAWEQGRAAGAQMVALTEMFVTGYQTQDLILKPAFAAHAERAVADLARQIVDGPALGIGGPLTRDGELYNAYYILEGGKIAALNAGDSVARGDLRAYLDADVIVSPELMAQIVRVRLSPTQPRRPSAATTRWIYTNTLRTMNLKPTVRQWRSRITAICQTASCSRWMRNSPARQSTKRPCFISAAELSLRLWSWRSSLKSRGPAWDH